MNNYGLEGLASKAVVFLANNVYTGPVDGVTCVLSMFGHNRVALISGWGQLN